jgi:hypothetical protein
MLDRIGIPAYFTQRQVKKLEKAFPTLGNDGKSPERCNREGIEVPLVQKLAHLGIFRPKVGRRVEWG